MNYTETFLGISSTVGVGLASVIPTDPGTIEALAKWPTTLVLAAVAVYSIYSMNKNQAQYLKAQETMSRMAADAQNRQSKAIESLTRELHERPCVRNPDNN